jgi:hypothetical protein
MNSIVVSSDYGHIDILMVSYLHKQVCTLCNLNSFLKEIIIQHIVCLIELLSNIPKLTCIGVVLILNLDCTVIVSIPQLFWSFIESIHK